jgi:hypothetical protein
MACSIDDCSGAIKQRYVDRIFGGVYGARKKSISQSGTS